MKKKVSREEARRVLGNYFSGKIEKEKTRKMKRLAMRHRISLKDYRRKFCKKCLGDLKEGKIRITKNYKIVECKCGYKNRWKIKIS